MSDPIEDLKKLGVTITPDTGPGPFHRRIVKATPIPNTRVGNTLELECGHAAMSFGNLEHAKGVVFCEQCEKVGDYGLPPCPCPKCGEVRCAATGERMPVPGDATICANCATILAFDADLRLRLPNSEDLKGWRSDSGFWEHLNAMRRVLIKAKQKLAERSNV